MDSTYIQENCQSALNVSVIIPTYNGKTKLAKLIPSLEKQTYSDFETIVVVDGSNDGTEHFLAKLEHSLRELRVIVQENKGRAGARNCGAKTARGELLIFFDDDIIVEPDALRIIINESQRIGLHKAILVGALEPYQREESEISRYSAFLGKKWNNSILPSSGKDSETVYLTAANFAVSAKVFKTLGAFNEKLKDAEDQDFAVKAKKYLLNIIYVSKAIAYHHLEPSFLSLLKRWRLYFIERSKVAAARGSSNMPLNQLKRVLYLPFSIPFWVKLFDKEVFKSWPEKLRFRLYTVVLTALSYYYPNRKL